jgi:Sap, sulfolipid-1-addressing protein
MGEVVLLSFTSAFNPTLIAVTTLMLLLPNPKRLMLGYWLGALLTSITLGLVIVFTLESSSVVSTTKHTLSPLADIVLGGLTLIIAAVLATGRDERYRKRRAKIKEGKPPPRWQRELRRGTARTTFVIGALLTLPGASYLAGLDLG